MGIPEVIYRPTVLLSLIILLGLVGGRQVYATGVIEVTGQAEVKVVADEVILSLGVETLDQDIEKSVSENNARVKRVFEVIVGHGVEAKKIQTDYMHCGPVNDREQRQTAKFIGYKVSKQIVVTLNDLSKFESVLSGVITAGVTNVHGIQFRSNQLRKHRDTARDMAMKHAKEKAEAMAAAVGQKIGLATSIKEKSDSSWSSYFLGEQRHMPYQSQVVTAPEGPSPIGETVAPGEIGLGPTSSSRLNCSNIAGIPRKG